MDKNKQPGRADQRGPGIGQGDQDQGNSQASVGQFGSVAVNVVESSGRLCKRITFGADESLQIEGVVQPYEGVITTARVDSMRELSVLLSSFSANQALACCNTPFPAPAPFTTKDGLTADKLAKGYIARTQEHLKWMPGPALLPLDHDDKGGASLRLPDFSAALAAVFPPFSDAGQLVTWSSSSCIRRKDNDAELRGPGSFHAYYVIRNGADLERFVRVLQKRLWLAGKGHILIGKSVV